MAADIAPSRLQGRDIDPPSTKTYTIYLSKISVAMKLRVPHHCLTGIASDAPENEGFEGGKDLLADVIDGHSKFRLSLPGGPTDNDKVLQHAEMEVKVIRLFFPTIHISKICVCMAAWLATLCHIDDVLEEMDSNRAVSILFEFMDVIRYGGSPPCDAALDIERKNVLLTGQRFREHCSRYLLESEITPFLGKIYNVIEGLQREMCLRQSFLPSDLSTYLAIRTRTIGVAPFFALIERTELPPNCLDLISDIQNDINLITGLQNDLIGLEKDIENGEMMSAINFVGDGIPIYKKGSEIGDITEAVSHIYSIHNQAVFRAIDKFKQLSEIAGPHASSALDVARAQLTLAETHLKWCTSSKRYQAQVQ
ncbi:hypothetical protein ASPZODRAFT_170177 [Penicilliopsis zonata CBS 506.65]|uniref:Terpene synthase n=1 Tax=Penicilliopsis zonata CBS 506.65 TaxID=1073090 RepID=A0A1L9S5G8_9EURO|nr:hypothetical protein ASPZODRAFT_170177 [Penicilliopsis zonata CBS 506.65]OJJ42377.1 hypothetical protein ASPZODRAFT_170177 [Penicilliopsis zonata CBS 506.65]